MKPLMCPHCKNDRPDMIELIGTTGHRENAPVHRYLCLCCSKEFTVKEND
jgi:transposase-like protein